MVYSTLYVSMLLIIIFQMTDLRKLNHFLGIDFDLTEGKVKMSQKRSVNEIPKRFEMQDFAPDPGLTGQTQTSLKTPLTDNTDVLMVVSMVEILKWAGT